MRAGGGGRGGVGVSGSGGAAQCARGSARPGATHHLAVLGGLLDVDHQLRLLLLQLGSLAVQLAHGFLVGEKGAWGGARAVSDRSGRAVRRIAAAAEARTLIMRLLSRICSFSVFLEAPMPIADYGFTTGGGRPLFARRAPVSRREILCSSIISPFCELPVVGGARPLSLAQAVPRPARAPHGAIDLALARRCCPGSMGVEAHAPFFSANSSHIF